MRSVINSFNTWRLHPERLRIRSKDRLLFAKRLSLYLRAGIPILEALDLIRDTPGSSRHARLLRNLSYEVQGGKALSVALSRFTRAYSQTQVQLISVGEASGTLPRSLSHLALLVERRSARIRSVVGSLAYPAILFVGSLGISIFLLLYAFPKIVPLFRGLHAQLPFTTRALLWLSVFIRKHWLLLILLSAGGGTLLMILLRRPFIKQRTHRLLLRLPFFGKLFRSLVLASIFRTIATLLSSGVRLDEALRMARDSISNSACRTALERIRRSILAGNKLSNALRLESFLFPSVSIQLMATGEMTGTLSESAESTAQIFDEELAERLQILSTALEPIIMITMGFVIGFIALAIISPMYGITQSLSV